MKALQTALSKHLADSIKLSGPMSVSHYMKTCLLHPSAGYYMKRNVFGSLGDFTTSPEISQMFGEMVGVFFINYWDRHKEKVSLVEIGLMVPLIYRPGKGTLMDDILRTVGRFPFLKPNVQNVHLVEASPQLRKVQASLLAPHCEILNTTVDGFDVQSAINNNGIKIQWHDTLLSVPKGPNYVVSHEFFDALPIFKFEVLCY
jgi:NADH dehydrogenase [ubiquinone] 1 alpha subcomplex assembly factor 7